MKFIHYGSKIFNPSLFKRAKNNVSPDNKPKHGTGFWASPVKTEYGWSDWCKEEQFRNCNIDNSFTFELSNKCRLLTIDSISDFSTLRRFSIENGIDFESLSLSYDAILLTHKGEVETRYIYPFGLCGWDCECILILNKEAIKQES